MADAHYFAAISGVRIAQHPADIENNAHYQAIRDEINARLHGPDWHKIKQQAEKLGREAGFGLLAAAYYTVASARTEGISGLADGLEITLAALLQPGQREKSAYPVTLNTLNWMANRSTDTVKHSGKSPGLLRDLYRCERACQAFEHTVDTEVLGLHTLHSLLTRKIKSIEQQRPNTPAQTTKTATPANSNKAKNSLLLLSAGALAWVCVLLVKAQWATPVGQLAEQTLVPRVLDQQQARQIQQAHGQETMQQHQAQITALYLRGITQHLHQSRTDNLQHAEQLLHTLRLLYPHAQATRDQENTIQAFKLARQASLADLSERFKQARTAIANLNRAVQQGTPKNSGLSRLKAQAGNLADYALSLSPLLGRSLYIEENLEQNNLLVAQQELAKLEQQMDAMALKVGGLKQALEQQMAAGPNIP